MSYIKAINKIYDKIQELNPRNKKAEPETLPTSVLCTLGGEYLQHHKTRDLIQVLAYARCRSEPREETQPSSHTFEVCAVKSLITGLYSVAPVKTLTISVLQEAVPDRYGFKNAETYGRHGVNAYDDSEDGDRAWTPIKNKDVGAILRKAKWDRRIQAWRELFLYAVRGPVTLKLHEVDRSQIFLLSIPHKELGHGNLIIDHTVNGRQLAFTIHNTWLPQRLPADQASLLESPAFQQFLDLGLVVLLNPNWVDKFTSYEQSLAEFMRVDSSYLFTDHQYDIEYFSYTDDDYLTETITRTAVNKSVDTYADE